MDPRPVSVRALRRLLLAQQGLLGWSGGVGRHREGVPWRERLRGAAGVLRALRWLEAIQLDPVNIVERNHHMVLLNRVADYRAQQLETHYTRRRVFEYWAQARCILPVERYGELAPRRRLWTVDATVARMTDHGRIRQAAAAIVKLLAEADGPLPARALDLGERVEGYWGAPTKVSSQALEHLWGSGEVVVAFRRGDERHYTLTARWHDQLPSDEPDWEALLRTCVRAYGVIDASDPRFGWRRWAVAERRACAARLIADGTLTPVAVDGLKRRYLVAAPLLRQLEGLEPAKVAPHVFFLPPLDNVLWRRERILDLFGFDYRWEIYVPDKKRTYGPYVLPVLEGDRFIGRVDARLDRDTSRLVLRRAWWEPRTTSASIRRALAALAVLAGRLDAELVLPRRTARD